MILVTVHYQNLHTLFNITEIMESDHYALNREKSDDKTVQFMNSVG
jgi:hypothetical protein